MLFRAPTSSTGGLSELIQVQLLQLSCSLSSSVCSAVSFARIGAFVIASSVYLFPFLWMKIFYILIFSMKLRGYHPWQIAESSTVCVMSLPDLISFCISFQMSFWFCSFCFFPGRTAIIELFRTIITEVVPLPGISKMLLCAQGILLVFSCGIAWRTCNQSIS